MASRKKFRMNFVIEIYYLTEWKSVFEFSFPNWKVIHRIIYFYNYTAADFKTAILSMAKETKKEQKALDDYF